MKASSIARLTTRPDVAGSSRLILPLALDAVVGVRSELWFEQICVDDPLPAFTLQGPGALEVDRWVWTPEASDVGTRKLRLNTPDGTISRSITVRPADCPGSPTLKVFAMGASFLTAAVPGNWLEYVDDDMTAAGGTIQWLGTTQAVGQSAHIFSEAHAGSSWRYWCGQDGNLPQPCPFNYDGLLDVGRYCTEELGGVVPDVAIIDVNTNSYGTARLDVLADFDVIQAEIDLTLDAMRAAWPNTWLCLVVAPPCNGILHPLGDDHRLRRHLYAEQTYANIRARRAAGQRVTSCQELACIDPDEGFPHSPENDHFDESGAVDWARGFYTFLRRFTG